MPASEQPGHRVGLRVLLVEDENLVAVLLEDMLAELGHSVVGPVARLKTALEMAQHEAIDFAILDVNINGEQAYPVAEALAARGIPFVFSTGYGERGLPPQYRGHPTLPKPFQQHDLQILLVAVARDIRGVGRQRGGGTCIS
jgi:CheY-like chemotaxis protein